MDETQKPMFSRDQIRMFMVASMIGCALLALLGIRRVIVADNPSETLQGWIYTAIGVCIFPYAVYRFWKNRS